MTQNSRASDLESADALGDTRAVSAVDLPKGGSLQPDETMSISCARATRVIIVVGAAESGKTTLLASIYERFLRGPWAGYVFAGSSTLLGFEQICHGGRGASGREVPVTPRTQRPEGHQLLHLQVRSENCSGRIQDLLLSDLSGEEFEDARHSSQDTRELAIVCSAQHVVLLVDGEKIADIGRRQAAKDEASLLLRSLVEESLLGATSRLDIIFTKWDIAMQDTAAVSFAEAVESELISRYASRLAVVRSFRVASRDPSGRYPPAYGLESAFPAWVLEPQQPPTCARTVLTEPDLASEYDRFFRRQLPAQFIHRPL